MAHAFTTRLACALAFMLGTTACRDIVGFDEAEPQTAQDSGDDSSSEEGPPAGLRACELPYATADCAACANQHCCDESSACAGEPGCAAQALCLRDCGNDPRCRAQCGVDGQVSQSSDASALAACLTAQCEDTCELTCGLSLGDYGEFPPDAASECHDCIVTNACTAASACAASADCDAFNRCFAACQTGDCESACYDAHPEGNALAKSVVSESGACESACARGANWTCVGRVTWPQPKADVVAFTLELNDRMTGVGFPGLEVTACDVLDLDCMRPRARGETTDDGFVRLQIQNQRLPQPDPTAGGLNGFLRVGLPDSDAVMSVYFGFPLSEPRWSVTDHEDNPTAYAWHPSSVDGERIRVAFNVTQEPSRGEMLAEPVDCMGRFAAGVTIAIEPPNESVTIIHSLSPGLSETNSDFMWANLFNVPVGPVTVTATPKSLGRPSSRQTVSVRDGSLTGIRMLPTP